MNSIPTHIARTQRAGRCRRLPTSHSVHIVIRRSSASATCHQWPLEACHEEILAFFLEINSRTIIEELTVLRVVGNKIILYGKQISVDNGCILELRVELITKRKQSSIEDFSSIIVICKASILIDFAVVLLPQSQCLGQATQWPCVVYPQFRTTILVYCLSRTS